MSCIHTISFLCGVPKREYAEIRGNADQDCGHDQLACQLSTVNMIIIYIQTMIGCCRSLKHLKICTMDHGALVFSQASEEKATRYGL